MAQSLKIVSWFVLAMVLTGCGITRPSTHRLANVLNTQEQADAAYRSNDMQHAAALYLQLTRIVPQEAEYLYMLGNAYVRIEQPDQAVQAYQQAIARNPNHTRAWHNLGIVRMRQAMAAFVSSADTARAGDPMRELSTQLADQLARIGQGSLNSSKPQVQTASATPVPVASSRRITRGAAGRRPATPNNTASDSWSNTAPVARRKPGASADADQQ